MSKRFAILFSIVVATSCFIKPIYGATSQGQRSYDVAGAYSSIDRTERACLAKASQVPNSELSIKNCKNWAVRVRTLLTVFSAGPVAVVAVGNLVRSALEATPGVEALGVEVPFLFTPLGIAIVTGGFVGDTVAQKSYEYVNNSVFTGMERNAAVRDGILGEQQALQREQFLQRERALTAQQCETMYGENANCGYYYTHDPAGSVAGSAK